MNNALKILNDQLATVRAEQSKCSASLGEIAAERFELEHNPSTKAAAVEAAENDLIEQLARHKFGEPNDVPAAEKALAAAKGLPDDRFEAGVRLRVLTTLEQRHTARYAELHAQGLALIEQIKRAEIDALNDMANDLRNNAKSAVEATAHAEALLNAVRIELNERGASYTLPPLNEQAVILACQPTQTQARAQIIESLAA